ncbi:multiple sugar transport system permease protein [Catenuloplanes nepalensis]|uniref:Multiple sugar transport system permease protein n=1 Tax=Catenuloplanes nepalensis TaxID=587533 RepID=A0ABT9MYX2_9ACTN|nr:sugar ABC transporter permease [Catenuloplanes nepalensis]MDP9796630.1 multiple sugar transport system permease protein [Catenuloplanes nepalensis]
MARRETWAAYGFLSPWIVGFLVFLAGPMVASLVLSFTDYDVLTGAEFVGADNYRTLFGDPRVRTSLGNTLFYTALHVPLTMVVSLALALLLNRAGRRSAGFFRTVFYLPTVTPKVAVGVLFLLLFNGQSGLVNQVLGPIGPDWTADPAWIKPGLVLIGAWSLGSTVIIYLAALRDVPRDLHEAAQMDGASAWARFRAVTVPSISGALFFTLIINTISGLQTFDEVYTAFYGSANQQTYGSDAALFYVVYLFQQAFQFLHIGYASALAWLLFGIIMAVTLVQVRLSRRFVHYGGG